MAKTHGDRRRLDVPIYGKEKGPEPCAVARESGPYPSPTSENLMKLLLLLAALAVSASAPVASALTFSVNSTADLPDALPGNNVCATSTGVCTLRAAIQEANSKTPKDTVLLPAGTYVLSNVGLTEDAAALGDLDITAPIVITGASAATTIIDGNAAGRVLHVFSNVTVQKATIRGGDATNELSANCPQRGGAICVMSNGILTLDHAIVTASQSRFGGAIYSEGGVTLVNTDVTASIAADQGGAYLNLGALTLRDSSISGNSTPGNGGAIWSLGAVTATRSTISANTAALSGGGIYSTGSVTLRDSTLSGNTATTGSGGGLFSEMAATLINTTVSANSAPAGLGGGLVNGTGVFGATAMSLGSTIVALNTAASGSPDCGGFSPVFSLGYNFIGNTAGCTITGDLLTILSGDPMLGTAGEQRWPDPHPRVAVREPCSGYREPRAPGERWQQLRRDRSARNPPSWWRALRHGLLRADRGLQRRARQRRRRRHRLPGRSWLHLRHRHLGEGSDARL